MDIWGELKKKNRNSTSTSSNGGPVSESNEAFNKLWRLHVATSAVSWSFLYLINRKEKRKSSVISSWCLKM